MGVARAGRQRFSLHPAAHRAERTTARQSNRLAGRAVDARARDLAGSCAEFRAHGPRAWPAIDRLEGPPSRVMLLRTGGPPARPAMPIEGSSLRLRLSAGVTPRAASATLGVTTSGAPATFPVLELRCVVPG